MGIIGQKLKDKAITWLSSKRDEIKTLIGQGGTNINSTINSKGDRFGKEMTTDWMFSPELVDNPKRISEIIYDQLYNYGNKTKEYTGKVGTEEQLKGLWMMLNEGGTDLPKDIRTDALIEDYYDNMDMQQEERSSRLNAFSDIVKAQTRNTGTMSDEDIFLDQLTSPEILQTILGKRKLG